LSIKELIKRVLPSWLIAIRRHRNVHGEFPNLIRPATFNEKILWRMLFDRRVVLSQIADKASVRSYVESRLGPQILPQLYYLTTCPETIPFDKLPDMFVVKPTHGSGWVQIVTDKSMLDRDALVAICTEWLSKNYYQASREWAYKNIKPQIIVEEYINDGTGAAPTDFKLFVFDGSVELIQADTERFTGHRRRLYTSSWENLDVLFEYDDIRGNLPPPPHLAEMLTAAQTLGQNLDFIRADFYDTPQGLYFGELTATPECALGRFRPREFDRYLGGCWKIPTKTLSKGVVNRSSSRSGSTHATF
jgi:hypothetical protein